MEFDWVEWFGYLASLVVLVSLTMTSIIKLRVINLIGCILFAMFAYFIDSYPTMFMNLGIACINLYYLRQIYSTKEQYKLIVANLDSEYFEHFINMNQADIERQTSPDKLRNADTAFYMLRNNSVAGVLIGNQGQDGELDVLLDYVTPEYRDLKLAHYLYESNPDTIKQRGIKTLVAHTSAQEHIDYLLKVGFELIDEAEGKYRKVL